EKDIASIKKGQKIRFRLTGENKERLATVYLIGKAIDSDRSIQVHGHLEKEDEVLVPGSFIQAEILAEGETTSWAVPVSALQSWQGTYFYFVQTGNNVFEIKEPKSPRFSEEWLFLDDSCKGSERIVTEGAFQLLSQLKNTGEEEE